MARLFYMSDSDYKKKLQKIERRNASVRRRRDLRDKKEYGFKLPSTTKLILWLVIFYCIHLTLFIEERIEVMGDSVALVSLIGVLTTMISVVRGYFNKSAIENSVGGITFEMAMMEQENNEPVG